MHKEQINISQITEVSKILHIADVHIRTLKRHEEYRAVFEKLYSICKEKVRETPNTLIYLAGDIVHAKTDMTPELVSIVTEFLAERGLELSQEKSKQNLRYEQKSDKLASIILAKY